MRRLGKMIVVLSVLILSFVSFQKASAAHKNLPNGFLIGDENGIKVSKDGGYFFNLNNLQPGDTVKRDLVINNNLDEDYELTLEITPKSQSGKIDLIKIISMQILLEDQEVYQGNLSNSGDGKKVVSFGTISAQSNKKAVINLTMGDIENWNQLYYSGPSEAEVEWVFTAVHSKNDDKVAKISTNPSESTGASSGTGKNYPSTGEVLMYGIIALGILIILVVVSINSKRKQF